MHTQTHTTCMHTYIWTHKQVCLYCILILYAYVETQPPVNIPHEQMNYVITLPSPSPRLKVLLYESRIPVSFCDGIEIFMTFIDIKMMGHILLEMNKKDKLG